MPLTAETPKPLLPVCNVPMLDHVTSQLKFYGVDDIVYAAAYRSAQIARRAAKYVDIKTRVRVESRPLGTAGCVKAASKYLSDVFFVLSGDCLNDIDLASMARSHIGSGADVTIAAVKRADTRKYGVISTDGDKVTSLIEKPFSNSYGNTVNAGIYVVNKRILSEFDGDELDFAKDVFPVLIRQGRVGVYRHEGFWSDVGAIEDYFRANFTVPAEGFFPRVRLKKEEPSLTFGSSVISPDARVSGTVNRSIIGAGASVGKGVSVSDCVVLPGGKVTSDVRYSVIGKNFEVNLLPIALSGDFSTDSATHFNIF